LYRYFKDYLTTNILFIPLSTWISNTYKIEVTAKDLIKIFESKGKYMKGAEEEEDVDEEIEIYPGYYRGVHNVYLEVNQHFIIQKLSSSELLVIGVSDNGKDRLLNDEEEKIVKEMELMVLDE